MHKINKNNTLARTFGLLLVLMSGQSLTGCSSSSSSTPAPIVPPPPPAVDANPIGYYTGSAAITVTAGDLTIDAPDLQAIVDADTFVVVSIAENLLYKGTITDITGNDYTATVRIYKDNYYIRSASVTGSITEQSTITGTITGTGDYANGSFNLTYSLLNSRAPLTFVMNTEWGNGVDYFASDFVNFFNTNTNTRVTITGTSPITELAGCDADNTPLTSVDSEQIGRIRTFATTPFVSCGDASFVGLIFDGYFTTYDDTGTDDAMLFVTYNDDYAVVSSFVKH